MKKEIINVSRRDFMITSGKLGAGFTLGLYLPGCSEEKSASKVHTMSGASPVAPVQDISSPAKGVQEVNAWVVIQPDDTVIVRIARSEMGQGTLTGLAQLVAEELECDWSKVTTEYPPRVKTLNAIMFGVILLLVAALVFAVVICMYAKAGQWHAIC